MVYGYIRVSTGKQNVENQRYEIMRFCRQNGLTVEAWIQETASGTTSYNKRRLGALMRRIQRDDLIVCTELSRMGRSFFMVMEILCQCLEKGCRVWTIKDHYRMGDDLKSKVIAFAFSLSAEIEHKLISNRTREAMAYCKALGRPIGRRKGSVQPYHKLKTFRWDSAIEYYASAGYRIGRIARILGINYLTLKRYLHRKYDAEVWVKTRPFNPEDLLKMRSTISKDILV